MTFKNGWSKVAGNQLYGH